MKEQLSALVAEREAAFARTQEKWSSLVNEISEITLAPYRKDVLLELFGVAWMPYYQVRRGQEIFELPGYLVE